MPDPFRVPEPNTVNDPVIVKVGLFVKVVDPDRMDDPVTIIP
jgi:hypothetical protein